MAREISRRAFLGTLAAGAAASLAAQAQGQRQTKKPNLLFVFSDEHSYDMLGCYGNRDVVSPNLDKFASQGLRFNHCVSSYPVCSPYRAMLLSGQHPLYNGVVTNDKPLLAHNGKYLPHVLRDAGYRMGYVGKWHLLGGDRNRPIPPGPQRHGFDDAFLSNNCHVNYLSGQCFYWNEEGEKVFFDEWEVYGQTRQALQFIDDCPEDQPFCLFVSWHPPHDMGWQPGTLVRNYPAPADLLALYDPDKLTLRPSVEDTPEVRKAYAGHYAMITSIDRAFGWLMDKLEEKGIAEDTLVVFTSDHGDNLSSYGHTLPKNEPQDTSVRVPCLMRFPGRIEAGQETDLLFGIMDTMPTLLGLMGQPIPPSVQGVDRSQDVLEGREDTVDSVPLFFLAPEWHGVYTHDHTYAIGTGPRWTREDGKYKKETHPVQVLYDRQNDPHQLENRFGDPELSEVQQALHAKTLEWAEKYGDPMMDGDELMALISDANGGWPNNTQAPSFKGRPINILLDAGKLPAKA